jgi:hypothetical protein
MTIIQRTSTFILVVFLLAVAAKANPLRAQTAESESSPSCMSSCPEEEIGLCHFTLGMFFLKGTQKNLPGCITKSIIGMQSDKSVNAIKKGIAELNLVLQDPKGLQVSAEDLRIIRAGAFTVLSRLYFRNGDHAQSEDALSSAKGIYHDLLDQTSMLAKRSIVKISVGLIKVGNPAESLAALQRLPLNDPLREYLSAEALFTMGDRQGAAKEYSRWIALKCESSPIMLSSDEYGEQKWSYLLPKGSGKVNRCKYLPEELRSRLEALKKETPYLRNLPSENHIPLQFPEGVDH